jgi:hypothetical protein
MLNDDPAGPTAERLNQAREFFTVAGRSRSGRRFNMLDDALGRAWMRQKISAEEYSALRRYALHWLAGGLQGHLSGIDPNRILAHDPMRLSPTERQQDHRDAYRAAHEAIGARPALVADQVACYDSSLLDVGLMLGYRSPHHARHNACELLREAGYRLGAIWRERDRN